MYIPKEICELMQVKMSLAPIDVQEKVYVFFDEDTGQPVFNVRRESCKLWNPLEGKCGAEVDHMVYDPRMWVNPEGDLCSDSMHWEKDYVTFDNFPLVDNPEWMDRSEEDDERTVDFYDMKAAEQTVADHKRAHLDNWAEYNRVPSKWVDFTTYNCVVNVDGKFHPCYMHTMWRVINSVVEEFTAGNIKAEEAAEILIPYCLRRSKWIPPVPKGGWTHVDRSNFYASLGMFATRLRMKTKRSMKSCYYYASKVMKKEHPEQKEYEDNLTKFKERFIPYKNLQLDKELGSIAATFAKSRLSYHGIKTSIELACRAMSKFAGNSNDAQPTILAGCPMCLADKNPDEAYPLIIRHTAVTERLREITSDMPAAEKYVVRTRKADMPATEFNKLSLEERMSLMDCGCEHCVQKDIFIEKTSPRGRKYFIVAAEVMLNEEHFDAVVDIMTRATSMGYDLIPVSEEDDFMNNLRTINVDFTDYEEESVPPEEWSKSMPTESWEHLDWRSMHDRQDQIRDLNFYVEPMKSWVDDSIVRKKK